MEMIILKGTPTSKGSFMTKKTIFFIVFVCWMLVIFNFSAQPYQEQDLTPVLQTYLEPLHLEDKLDGISFNYAGSEVSVQSVGVVSFVQFFIRKAAHLSIFFVLGFLSYRVLSYFLKKKQLWFPGALMFVILYASLDELHQKITGDRTPLLQDVVLDTVGGTLGIIVCWLWVKKRNQTKQSA